MTETLLGWRELTGLDESGPLKALVYDTTLEEISSLRAEALGGPAGDLARENQAAAALVAGRRLDIIDYLLFLRQSESRFRSPDAWEYRLAGQPDDVTLSDISPPGAFFAQAEAAASAGPPEALRRRYIYQMFSIGFYNFVQHDKLKDLFVGEVAGWPDDEPIREWCRSYYAGMLFHDGDLTGAFKEFAQVYARSLRGREAAHVSLHLILLRQAGAGLAALKRPDLTPVERKAVQLVLNSFSPDLEAILAASLEKGWPLPHDVNQRLTGFLNAENDRLLVNLAPHIPWRQSRMEKSLGSLAALQDDPAPWYLGAANLSILRGDAAEARKFMRLADQADLDRRHRTQLVVLRALSRAYLEPLNRRGEAALLGDLSWLIGRGRNYRRLLPDLDAAHQPNPEAADRLDAALEAILGTILPDRYSRQGRDDRSALVLALSGDPRDARAYVSAFPFWKLIQSPPGRLRRLAATLGRPRTPFERFLVGAVPWTPDYPLELAGSYYIRAHRFDEAEAVLAAIPEERRRAWTEGSSGWDEDLKWRRSPSMSGAHNPFAEAPYTLGDLKHAGEDDPAHEALFGEARRHGLSAQSEAVLAQLSSEPADRLEFAGRMARLRELSGQRGEAGAMAGLFYARALYNISWHGRSWRMSAWGRSICEAVGYAELGPQAFPYFWLDAQVRRYRAIDHEDQYHYPTDAHKALRRALAKTANPELRARLIFMLADMDQIDWRWWRRYGRAAYADRSGLRDESMGLKKSRLLGLAARFGDTAFVRQASMSCPWLREFL
ncbi:MAG: hypothetical protein LBP92_13760 [Deltaproteobacteria bacterium]|nr:hypothetical protein [Deltaproteobacteria bacterium]